MLWKCFKPKYEWSMTHSMLFVGRGRGDGYMQRGITYEEVEGGGFGRPRQRPDGSWDEG